MNRILKDSLYNLIGFILPLFIALIFIPLLIKALGDFKFGLLGLAWTLLGYLSLLDVGFGRSITILISENWALKNIDQVKKLFSNAFLLVILIGLFFTCVSLIIYPLILQSFFLQHVNNTDVILSLIFLSLSIPIITTFSILRGFLEGLRDFKFVNIGRLLLGFGIFVVPYIITFFTTAVSTLILSIIIIRLLLNVFFIARVSSITSLKVFVPKIQKDIIVKLFHLSGWITISNFISSFIVYLDRFLIGVLISVTAVTYYITPFELVTKILLIPIAITGVLFPVFAANNVLEISQNMRLFFKSIDTTYILFSPIIIIIIIASDQILTLWVGPEFAIQSSLILQILSLGVYFNGLAQYPFSLLQALEKPKLITFVHIFEAILFIPLLVIIVQNYGLIGAAVVWSLRSLFDFSVLYWIAIKLIRKDSTEIPPNYFILISTLFLFIILILLSNILLQLFISLIFLTPIFWYKRNLIISLFRQMILLRKA